MKKIICSICLMSSINAFAIEVNAQCPMMRELTVRENSKNILKSADKKIIDKKKLESKHSKV